MNPRLKKILLFILLPFFLSLLFTACDSGSTPAKKSRATTPKSTAAAIPDQLLLAEIDGRPVTGTDLKKYLGLFKESEMVWPAKPETREKLINHLIDRELLLEAARKQGYFKIDELKKHGHLQPSECETIALRAFLNDKIARPATPDQAAITNYRKQHPDLSAKQAREKLASARQIELFKNLMASLKKEHKIVIHRENLTKLPTS